MTAGRMALYGLHAGMLLGKFLVWLTHSCC
jgi:hypothetical protein